MPATEETWRNQKLLHVVFGVTSLAMLLSSLLLFAKDHDRQWKGYQRKYRDVERTLTDWQLKAESSRWNTALKPKLEQELAWARAQAPAPETYDELKQLVLTDTEARQAAPVDFAPTDALHTQLATAAERIAKLREQAAQATQALEAARKAVAAQGAAPETPPGADGEVERSSSEPGAAAADPNAGSRGLAQADEQANRARAELEQGLAAVVKPRQEFFARLGKLVDAARYRENQLLSKRKFCAADFDAARADLDLLIRDEAPESTLQVARDRVDKIKADLDQLTVERERATTHRLALEERLKRMSEEEAAVLKQLADGRVESDRLQGLIDERDSRLVKNFLPGKRWLELPILDAFNSPLKIDNLWTDGLTLINGSFGQVRRFDRCTTCHKGIAKTAAGSAVEPSYVPSHEVTLTLATPDEAIPASAADPLAEVFGIQLAECGLVTDDDVTVQFVAPNSSGARAEVPFGSPETPGVQVGDILVAVQGDRVGTIAEAREFLLGRARGGEPIELTVRRGLPEPFTTHPRMDLFVGSLSPHPMAVFACTSCHEGQGSATDFRYASHAPDTLAQAEEWGRTRGWFNNPHWIYPMYPRRFAESTCLRCHHDVNELNRSERFPDPPAPKLMAGFNLVADYGCYGCHEINGYSGKDRRLGPDMRLEPNYFAAAATIKADRSFAQQSAAFREDIENLIAHPDRDATRHRIRDYLAISADAEHRLADRSLTMRDVLQDEETPGQLRKVGPSLRYVGSKLSAPFLYDWIREPSHFRPTTKMPRFFGLWKHLEHEPTSQERSERWEPVEILGVVTYLLAQSQPFDYVAPTVGVKVESASAERGKLAFEVRGCLACHQHVDFPVGTATQGPELSNLGDKFRVADTPNAKGWLYSWLRQPNHYSP
ncbi:MAG TPA: hypothetical protein VIY86_10420, partial [Pirellulaceae bacterium]